MAAGDVAGPVDTALSGLSSDVPTVAAGALAVGVLLYGIRRLWRFGKGLI
jgi:hypothetical protein